MSATYEIEVEKELLADGKCYYVIVQADVEFAGEEGIPVGVEIKWAKIDPEEGDSLPWEIDGRTLQRVAVTGNKALTEAIDNALWDEIQRFDEDNCADIARDIDESRYDSLL